MINCKTCTKNLPHRLREGYCATCKKEREYIHKKRAKYMHYYERLLSDGFKLYTTHGEANNRQYGHYKSHLG